MTLGERYRELEESEQGADAHKAEITELALRYGLVSPFTSFIATAEGDQAVEGTMRQVEINASASLQHQVAPPAALRHPTDKIQQINAQIDDVKSIMSTNIGTALHSPITACFVSLERNTKLSFSIR